MIELGDEDFGCFWAPDVIYDRTIKTTIHWTSAHASNNYGHKAIYSLTGDYVTIEAFNGEMAKLGNSKYEAPTAYKLSNGKWCLMLDFFGVEGEGQGYLKKRGTGTANRAFTTRSRRQLFTLVLKVFSKIIRFVFF